MKGPLGAVGLCACDLLSIRNAPVAGARCSRRLFLLPRAAAVHTSAPLNAHKQQRHHNKQQQQQPQQHQQRGPKRDLRQRHNALESSPTSSRFKPQKARMQLSRDVGRPMRSGAGRFVREEGSAHEKRREVKVVERGGGMNRRKFTAPDRHLGRRRTVMGIGDEERFAPGKSSQSWRTGRGRRGNVIPRASQPSSTPNTLDTAVSSSSTASSSSKWVRPPDRILKYMAVKAALHPRADIDRKAATAAIEKYKTFEDLGLLPEVIEAVKKDALGDLGVIEPSPVQRLVVPELMREANRQRQRYHGSLPVVDNTEGGNSVKRKKALSYLIAAETGSGKTLAYLLPIIDALKRKEKTEQELTEQQKTEREWARLNRKPMRNELIPEEGVNKRDPKAAKPLAVVLVPTSELAAQVGNLASVLSHIPKFRARMISREVSGPVIRSRLFSGPIDILVSTPHLLNSITEADPNIMSLTSHIVVDEADSLFDRSFSTLTRAIIAKAKNLDTLVLCSATIPQSLDKYLEEHYPDMKRLATPNLHAIPRHVQLSITDVDKVPYSGNKLLACADVLDQISRDNTEMGFAKRVVVFVNQREDTTKVTEYLHVRGFNAVDVNRDTKSRPMMDTFTGPKEERPDVTGRKRLSVLVTTDISSRGIDTKTVRNVVLYDVPHTTVDFIHRVGRTGRMGRRGKAFVLAGKDSNMEWLKDIKKAMFLGKALV